MADAIPRSRNQEVNNSVLNHEVIHFMPLGNKSNHLRDDNPGPISDDTKIKMDKQIYFVDLSSPFQNCGSTNAHSRPGNFIQPLDQKQPTNGAQSKTPVSILQETLSRKGLTPKYELLQEEGAIHEPTFRYRVTVADIIATGTGRSKKEAKHSAAKSILDKLKGPSEAFSIPDPPKKEPDDNFENPIGELQELCMSRRWPPPAYLTEREEGLPHEREFTIACQVFRYKELGKGKSKKVAKRLAAQKMLTFLQGVPCEDNNTNFGLDDEDELVQRLSQLDSADMKTKNMSQSIKVAHFHWNLRNSKGPKLRDLQTLDLTDSSLDSIKVLKEIAEEQNFNVTFVDIEEKSVSGKRQCLVQLSTIPVAVCCGAGKNVKEAQHIAAFTALSYLRHMSKNNENETTKNTM